PRFTQPIHFYGSRGLDISYIAQDTENDSMGPGNLTRAGEKLKMTELRLCCRAWIVAVACPRPHPQVLEPGEPYQEGADSAKKNCYGFYPDACEGGSVGSPSDCREATLSCVCVVERVLIVCLSSTEVSQCIRVIRKGHLSISLGEHGERGAGSRGWCDGAAQNAIERVDHGACL